MSLQFEGGGTLQPAEASGPQVPVNFSFAILRESQGSRPGLPPPPPRLHGRGDVRSPGVSFAEGYYNLRLADGQQVPRAEARRRLDPACAPGLSLHRTLAVLQAQADEGADAALAAIAASRGTLVG